MTAVIIAVLIVGLFVLGLPVAWLVKHEGPANVMRWIFPDGGTPDHDERNET